MTIPKKKGKDNRVQGIEPCLKFWTHNLHLDCTSTMHLCMDAHHSWAQDKNPPIFRSQTIQGKGNFGSTPIMRFFSSMASHCVLSHAGHAYKHTKLGMLCQGHFCLVLSKIPGRRYWEMAKFFSLVGHFYEVLNCEPLF